MSAVSPQVIPLPGQFGQLQLAVLKEIVDHHRDDGSTVQFDAADLERMDGAAAQFLLAVAMVQGDNVTGALVVNANDILLNVLIDMGLDESITTQPPVEQSAA